MTGPGMGSPDVQVGTAQQADAVTYRTGKLKSVLCLLGGLLFAWLGIGLLPTRPLTGLLGSAFGVLVSALMLATLVSSRVFLRVDDDGFELCGVLGKTKVRWADVEPPYASSILGFEAIKFSCVVAQETRFALLGRRQIGNEIAVTNGYGTPLREIHEEMRVRYQKSHPGIVLAPMSRRQDEWDISWKTLAASQFSLLVLYVAVAPTALGQPLTSALRAFATCLGLVAVLFFLSERTIRWGGSVVSSGPHPRFPSGKQPRPRLQFLIGTVLTSALFLMMFWPWDRRA